jgi:hypothetical protein
MIKLSAYPCSLNQASSLLDFYWDHEELEALFDRLTKQMDVDNRRR